MPRSVLKQCSSDIYQGLYKTWRRVTHRTTSRHTHPWRRRPASGPSGPAGDHRPAAEVLSKANRKTTHDHCMSTAAWSTSCRIKPNHPQEYGMNRCWWSIRATSGRSKANGAVPSSTTSRRGHPNTHNTPNRISHTKRRPPHRRPSPHRRQPPPSGAPLAANNYPSRCHSKQRNTLSSMRSISCGIQCRIWCRTSPPPQHRWVPIAPTPTTWSPPDTRIPSGRPIRMPCSPTSTSTSMCWERIAAPMRTPPMCWRIAGRSRIVHPTAPNIWPPVTLVVAAAAAAVNIFSPASTDSTCGRIDCIRTSRRPSRSPPPSRSSTSRCATMCDR